MYQVIDQLDVKKIRDSLVQVEKEVWPFNIKDWSLTLVKSDYVDQYIKDKFSSFELYGGHTVLSRATSCSFHNDLGTTQDIIYTVSHRLLVCLTDNYYYEWDANGKKTVYRPKLGDVIVFNNCELHRFVMDEVGPEFRETLMINLVDKSLLPLLRGMST